MTAHVPFHLHDLDILNSPEPPEILTVKALENFQREVRFYAAWL